LITFANESSTAANSTTNGAEAQDVRRGSGLAAVFLTRFVRVSLSVALRIFLHCVAPVMKGCLVV
jgi:hypothetical protein